MRADKTKDFYLSTYERYSILHVYATNKKGYENTSHTLMESSNIYRGSPDAYEGIPFWGDMYFNNEVLPQPTKSNYYIHYDPAVWSDDWYSSHGNTALTVGDTLRILDYRVRVTRSIAQRSDNSQKAYYDVNNSETTVDYRNDFSFISKVPLDHTTTVTIVDTLPTNVEFNNDAVLGGTYTPDKYGHHVYPVGGTPLPATSVVKNEDGTTTVTFVIENYNIKNKDNSIFYSAKIQKNFVENNDLLDSQTTIETTEFRLPKKIVNENISYAPIRILKLDGLALSKIADNLIYDTGENISYTLSYDNFAKTRRNGLLMLDMLPYNGDNRETNYHGDYVVSNFNLSQSVVNGKTAHSAVDGQEIYYTTDESYRGKTTKNITEEEIRSKWVKATTNLTSSTTDTETITTLNTNITNIKPVAIAILGYIDGNTSLIGHVTLKTNGAKPNDVYVNGSSLLGTNAIGRAVYVKRVVSGYAFEDKDKNGLYDGNDIRLSGVTVKLVGKDGAVMKNLFGEIMQTVTNNEGYYQFANLPKQSVIDEAHVEFSSGTKDITLFDPTKTNVSSEKDKTSKVTSAIYAPNHDLTKAIAPTTVNIEQRFYSADNTATTRIELTHIDAGLVYRTVNFDVYKVDSNNQPLKGAKLAWYSNGIKVDEWTTDGTAHTFALRYNTTYQLQEITSPLKYFLAKNVTVVVDRVGNVTIDGKQVTSYTMKDVKIAELPNTGRKNMTYLLIFSCVGLILSGLYLNTKKHNQKKGMR